MIEDCKTLGFRWQGGREFYGAQESSVCFARWSRCDAMLCRHHHDLLAIRRANGSCSTGLLDKGKGKGGKPDNGGGKGGKQQVGAAEKGGNVHGSPSGPEILSTDSTTE